MKIYRGWREGGKVHVTINCFPLNPKRELWDYINDFEWGYNGRGSAQLALALLADCLGDDQQALLLHQNFKRSALIPMVECRCWMLTDKIIEAMVATL